MENNSLKSSFNSLTKDNHYSFTGLHESVVTYVENKKNSSFMTIVMTTNTMTMTAILILPLLYQSYGIVTCSLVIFISAYIQYKTCSLILTHFDGKQDDLSLIIARIMGIKWKLTFNIAILIVQLSVVLIYYLLACNVIFPIVVTCLGNENYQKEKSHLTFNEFSFQYAALIATLLAVVTININNIQLIIKLGNIGFITLMVFLIFIIYTTIHNFSGSDSKSLHASEINIVKPNLIYIAGASSMSFLIHPSAPAIFQQQKDQAKNQRDLAISYAIAIVLNILFGLFGYLGIFLNEVKNGTTANTVMDYYTGAYTLIVCFLFIAKLSTGIPIIFYIACQQLFSITRKQEAKPPTFIQRQIFNLIVLALLTTCGIFNLDPTIAISISGAILGYIIGYLIPVLMHLKCIYGILPWEKHPENYEQMIDQNTGILKNEYLPMHLTDGTKCLIVEQESNSTEENQVYKKCYCRHEDVVKISRRWRYTFFTIILLIGLAEICAQFYQIVEEIHN